MFHRLNQPLTGANGLEIRVDPLDRPVLPLAVTLAGYQEDKDQKCFHVPHVADPHQWLLLPRHNRARAALCAPQGGPRSGERLIESPCWRADATRSRVLHESGGAKRVGPDRLYN